MIFILDKKRKVKGEIIFPRKKMSRREKQRNNFAAFRGSAARGGLSVRIGIPYSWDSCGDPKKGEQGNLQV